MLPLDWHHVIARFCVTYNCRVGRCRRSCKHNGLTHLSLILLHINLVPKNNEREVLRIMGTRLDQEFVPPAIEGLKRLGAVHVVYENTAVRAAVECDAKGLESFLTSGVPELMPSLISYGHGCTKEWQHACIVTRRSSAMTSFVKLFGVKIISVET